MADGTSPGFTFTDEPREPDEDAVARLAKLDSMEYGRLRKSEAKRLGVNVGILDKAVDAARAAREAPKARRLGLAGHVPWDHPVHLAALLDELAAALARHMVMPTDVIDVTALWVAHTWVYDRFERTPRLVVTSPTKRCGKSTLLEILAVTSRRSLRADNISASGVFRTVEAMAPLTLVVDEADSFLGENEELRGVICSGFARDGQVIRVAEVNGEHVAVSFATFAPVAIAAIKKVPDTIADRAVPVRLARKTKAESVKMLRAPGSREQLAALGRKAARWAMDEGDRLGLNPDIPDALGDREGDISVPLLSIADLAGDAWGRRARKALLGAFNARAKDEGDTETGIMLLADVRAIFLGTSSLTKASKDICAELAKMDDRPWPEWRQGRPITPTQLAIALRPFRVRSATIRFGQTTDKGYHKQGFEDAWTRYLPEENAFTPPGGGNGPSPGNVDDVDNEVPQKSPVTGDDVLRAENPEDGSQHQQSYGVTAETPPLKENEEIEDWEVTL